MAAISGKTRRRQDVIFDGNLRIETEDAAKRFHELVNSRITPKPDYSPKCDSCSMYDLCLPKTVEKTKSINRYLMNAVRE